LFIVGMTRGGNTWLGKIFDAHPDVLYRHEPDSILKTKTVPAFCPILTTLQAEGITALAAAY